MTEKEIKNSKKLIKPRLLEEEMQESYLDYAMSVIVSRALPDVRDGLKPVHRRILYAMWNVGLKSSAKFRKSAAVVGEVLGKYHPHGDAAVYDSLVRMAQDFSLRYPLIWGQGNFGCFTKDMKVKLTDGRNLSFEELVKEYIKGKKNYTYTVNHSGLISIAEIKHPRLTRRNAKILKIILDNGEKIKCTLNHLFMLKDGSYKEAKDLRPGESLIPLYQKLSKKTDRLNREGYILVYQNKTGEWVPTHHLADNYNLSMKKYSKTSGRVRHHLDFNKLNNNPDNIIRIHWGEHWQTHYENTLLLHQDEEYRKKIAEGRKKYWSNPKHKEKYSKNLSLRNIRNWQDPEYRKKMSKFLSDVNKEYIKSHPEKRLVQSIRASKILKRLWQEPYYRKLFNEKIVKANKQRITNNTGKVKFLKICKEVLNNFQTLNRELYEQTRNRIYPYGSATSWNTGFKKYYDERIDSLFQEVNKNHKVLKVEFLNHKEDVYDLTIEGTHNFALAAGVFVHNSMDGDAAAAMRYTEAKLSPIAEEMLLDIEKNTVNFVPNYDGTQKEPQVLPAKLPNILINGAMGIAVGMATNIPPHNLGEVVGALIHLIDHSNATMDELMQFVKGPDFPTGGIIFDINEIKQAYATGKGKIVMRAKTEITEEKSDQFKIIISEVPYQLNKANLLEKIAELVKNKKIEGIKDLRDESSREGVRVVVELKKEAYPKKILNRLFQLTPLQDAFHVNMLALIVAEGEPRPDGREGIQPRVLTLKMILEEYINHRQKVVKRRTEYELAQAKDRAHILAGLKLALIKIDSIIQTIKKSKDREIAKINLIKKFKLTERQAIAILEMKLQQLASLERLKVEQELKQKLALIKELESILKSAQKIKHIIKKELLELKEKYQDQRKTTVVFHGIKTFTQEDLIPNEDTIITITRDGYIKRLPPESFKAQIRGGKGVIGLTTKEEDVVEHFFATTTHSNILFFTTTGKVFQLKAYDIPSASRQARGQAIVNFLQLSSEEKVSAALPLSELGDYKYLVMVTKKGIIKKVNISDFSNVRRSGLIAIRLKKSDQLEWVKPSTSKDDIILVTAQGQAIRFREMGIRPMGRVASGVKGIRLKAEDEVVGMDIINPLLVKIGQLLIVMANGFGKRTNLNYYKTQGRGGSGIKTAKITPKTGPIVGAQVVNAKAIDEDMIIISRKGQVIRLSLKTVKVLGRATQGVRLMKFKEPKDQIASVTFI